MKRVFKFLLLFLLCFAMVLTGCKAKDSTQTNNGVTTEVGGEENSTTETGEEDNFTTEAGGEENSTTEAGGKEEATTEAGGKEEATTEADKEKPTTPPAKPDTDIPSGSVINIDSDKLPYTQEQIYSQLFDINNKIEIKVDISDKTLAELQSDYEEYSNRGTKSPIYRKADLDITIKTAIDTYTYHIDDIGIRMKGNTSRTSFYNDDEGVHNLIHFKVDFQETFDDTDYYSWDATDWGNDTAARDARKDRTFATLEKLEFKWNRNDDGTYIREYYTYEFYRANGVLAPRTNLTSFDLGDLHQGVFMMYEPVDKVFIEKNVPKEDQGGDLYKCGWTHSGAGFFADSSIGIEDEETGQFYNYDLKTNKKTSDFSVMKNLLEVVNKKSVTKEQLASVIDIDNFLKFEAVAYFSGNPDDVRNNYNNYYIYFNASTGKMVFIPYDMDRCLGVTHGWDPTGNGMISVNPFSKYAAGANQNQANPIYIKTVDEGGFYVAEFAEVLKTVSQSEWLTEDNFNKYYDIAYNNYKDDTTPDKTYYNADRYGFRFDNSSGAGGNMSFKEYITAKLATYNSYADKSNDYASSVQPHYIRGSFTNWSIEEKYKMTYDKSTKTYFYNLILLERSPLKVNNGIDGGPGEWYGCEDVETIGEGVNIEADQDDNIVLDAGSYKLSFNAETFKIKIEKN